MQQPYRSVWTELLDTPFRQAWVDAGGLKTRFIQACDPTNPPHINFDLLRLAHVRALTLAARLIEFPQPLRRGGTVGGPAR
jgi:hypothetical protein